MKSIPLLVSCCLVSFSGLAQSISSGTRQINFRSIGKDSINLSLNNDYDLIEDSCADIIRFGHANLWQRRFKGNFKDISTKNKGFVLSEGTYSEDGLKTGTFTSHYLSGSLQTKGEFKNDRLDGSWETFYENGKPHLNFDASDGNITIKNAWDEHGKKYIDNGKGSYKVETEILTWKGKLVNGKPDGTWHAYKTNDATETDFITEYFKNGMFQKGNWPVGDYTNGSKLTILSVSLFPYLKAEQFQMARFACNGAGYKRLINAQYRNGMQDFSEAIKEVITPFLSTVDLTSYENEFSITGEITDKGQLTKLRANKAFNFKIADGLINRLYRLPFLVPASVDGKPVKQDFEVTFTFNRGYYSFRYRFLEIK